MREFRISRDAQEDLDAILEVSEDRWGADARDRYERLIAQAFRQIASDPMTVLGRERRALPRGVKTLHLRAISARPAVREPVHVVFYRVTTREIEIIRVLHERMHFESHLGRR
jgi:toxin ParE1/3/4